MDMAVIKRILLIGYAGGGLIYFPCRTVAQVRPAAAPSHSWSGYLSGKLTLDSLTHYLNLHSSLRITYDSRKIQGNRPIYFPAQSYTITTLLGRIRREGRLTYSFLGDHVILSNAHVQRPRAATAHDRVSYPNLRLSPVALARIIGKDSLPQKIQAPPARAQPLLAVAATATTERQNEKSLSPPKTHPIFEHLQVGFSGNEVLYGNVIGEAGWRFLHLLAGAGAGPRGLTWSTGLGSMIAGNDDQQLQVRLLYSPMRSTASITDTAQHNTYTVKGKLFRLEALWCKQLGPHWAFKIGPTLSLLKTSYYLHGTLTAPGSFQPITDNRDKLLFLLKPPFLLYNSYSNTSPQNYKLWPGLSLTFCYSF